MDPSDLTRSNRTCARRGAAWLSVWLNGFHRLPAEPQPLEAAGLPVLFFNCFRQAPPFCLPVGLRYACLGQSIGSARIRWHPLPPDAPSNLLRELLDCVQRTMSAWRRHRKKYRFPVRIKDRLSDGPSPRSSYEATKNVVPGGRPGFTGASGRPLEAGGYGSFVAQRYRGELSRQPGQRLTPDQG